MRDTAMFSWAPAIIAAQPHVSQCHQGRGGRGSPAARHLSLSAHLCPRRRPHQELNCHERLIRTGGTREDRPAAAPPTCAWSSLPQPACTIRDCCQEHGIPQRQHHHHRQRHHHRRTAATTTATINATINATTTATTITPTITTTTAIAARAVPRFTCRHPARFPTQQKRWQLPAPHPPSPSLVHVGPSATSATAAVGTCRGSAASTATQTVRGGGTKPSRVAPRLTLGGRRGRATEARSARHPTALSHPAAAAAGETLIDRSALRANPLPR